MKDSYAIIIEPSGQVTERVLGDHTEGVLLTGILQSVIGIPSITDEDNMAHTQHSSPLLLRP